jgi:hypothetical protein
MQARKKARRPITPGLRDWKTQMPAEEVEQFEAAAGELLDELGYERAFLRPKSEVLERAARLRCLLARAFPRPQRDMVAENPLPAGEESGLGVE